jgi:hypothetical protein
MENGNKVFATVDRDKLMTPPAKRMRYSRESSELRLGSMVYSSRATGELLSLRRSPELFCAHGSIVNENGSPQPLGPRLGHSRKRIIGRKGVTTGTIKATKQMQSLPHMARQSSANLYVTDHGKTGIDEGSINKHITFRDASHQPTVINPPSNQNINFEAAVKCVSDVLDPPSAETRNIRKRSRRASSKSLPSIPLMKNERGKLIHSRDGNQRMRDCENWRSSNDSLAKSNEESTNPGCESHSNDDSLEKTLVSQSNSVASETLIGHGIEPDTWESSLRTSHKSALDILFTTSRVCLVASFLSRSLR